jgi:hypothetical protein
MQGVHNRTSHLTQLYSDVKKSALTDLQPTLSPQFSDLHRKYRIQKDRLIAWGLAWSDDGKGPDGNIDESVARAGLTETVDSVLRNIKEVTEEAERIRRASLPGAYNKDGVKSLAPVDFDETRYEDLLRDLTTSIDILYDLSDSRRALARGEHPRFDSSSFNTYPVEKSRAGEFSLKRKATSGAGSHFGSEKRPLYPASQEPLLPSYTGLSTLPPKVEPAALYLPVGTSPPPYEGFGVPSTTRLIAQIELNDAPKGIQMRLGGGPRQAAVLIEYAQFDPAYRDTGVPPPLQRLEALAPQLSYVRPENRPAFSLLGYFEDPMQPRIGLIYELPHAIRTQLEAGLDPNLGVPLSLLKLVQRSNKTQTTSNEATTPALEDRFRMALRLVEQLYSLHNREIAHCNINSSSVMFATTANDAGSTRFDAVRAPVWTSFDLFSKCAVEGPRTDNAVNIYKHPLDSPTDTTRDFQADFQFDLYGLGLILLEIGLWMPIGDLYKQRYSVADFKLRVEKIWIPKLAAKCGTAYQQAVAECLALSDNPSGSKLAVEGVYGVLLQYLRRCVLIDEVDASSGLISAAAFEAEPEMLSPAPTEKPFTPPPQQVPGELAVGWEEKTTADGRTFYIDHNTRTTTWVDPRTSAPPSVASRDVSRTQSFPAKSGANTTPVHRSLSEALMSPSSTPQQQRRLIRSSTLPKTSRESTAPASFQITNTPSTRDFKRRITFIQQRWRARQASRKLAMQTGIEPGVVPRSRTRIADVAAGPREKRYEFPEIQLPPEILEHWQSTACFQLQSLVERALRGSLESSSIRLVAYGTTPSTARPTFIVGCTSTAKVKNILKRHFKYDSGTFDVRVKKEDVRRCRGPRRKSLVDTAHRSVASMRDPDVPVAANPDYQERPMCGASIGAYRDDEHLPPASFGGIILVDGRPYGMSVHHMLELDDDDEAPAQLDDEMDDDESETSSLVEDTSDMISEDDDQSTVRPPSVYMEEDDSEEPMSDTVGDAPGIMPGDFEEIIVTQPALDDAIDLDLHVDESDSDSDSGIDEDHLLSYKFGQVHASSGLRRTNKSFEGGFKSISQSLPQEIDWALFELLPPRTYHANVVRGGSKYCARSNRRTGDSFPAAVRNSTDLACVKVHCRGRTSGLGSGVISSTMELVKIHGRHTFSASWTIAGDFGVGGDSGAWVVSNEDGRVCGHVLAAKKGRTYICPMDLLIEDIKLTLGASEVELPMDLNVVEITAAAGPRRREDEQMMSEAIDRLRIMDTDSGGGVRVPPSPNRAAPPPPFARTEGSMQTAR